MVDGEVPSAATNPGLAITPDAVALKRMLSDPPTPIQLVREQLTLLKGLVIGDPIDSWDHVAPASAVTYTKLPLKMTQFRASPQLIPDGQVVRTFSSIQVRPPSTVSITSPW